MDKKWKTGMIVALIVVLPLLLASCVAPPSGDENNLKLKQEKSQTEERSAFVSSNSPGTERYLISVFAFHDFNGNGDPDRGEPPIKGITISTAGLSCVTDPNGECDLGCLSKGEYQLAIQDPSDKFRYILLSVSEVKPIDNRLEIAVDRNMEVLVPLGEGFLTLPTRRRRLKRIRNYVDVGDVYSHTFRQDWRGEKLTYSGHQGTDFDISNKTVVAAAPGIIIGVDGGLPEIGTRVVIYHPDSGESLSNFFLTEYNDLKSLHKNMVPLPFNYDSFKRWPSGYIESLDFEHLQKVRRGDMIGYTGYRGRILHFECWTTDSRHTKGEPLRIIDPYLALFKDGCNVCIFANHLYSLWTVENDPKHP